MTFFREERSSGATYNPFENPTVPLSSVALDSVFGALSQTDSGESVTEENSVTLPIVWRCVGLTSTVVAGCPIRTYKNPGKVEVFPRLLDQGNAEMLYTQYELWELIVCHLMLWGNAFVLKLRGIGPDGPGSGRIIDLRPVNPGRIKVKLDQDGNKIFEMRRLTKDGREIPGSKPIILTTFEMMHIPGLGYDGLSGLSPIELARRTVGTGMAGDKLAAKFYSKGTMLSGVINVKAPLANQTQADSIRNRWIQKSGGTGHAAEVAVLDAETAFQPLTIPPDQLQFLESRRWQTTEIARLYGIPPHLVGDVEKSTSWGAGIEQQNIAFVSYTINGWTKRIQQRVTREIIATNKQFCEFDLDTLLRGDMSERFEAYNLAINAGWMNCNQARGKENMEPAPGLDDYLMPLNMQTVKQANQAAKTAQDTAKKALETPAQAPAVDPNSAPDDDKDPNSGS